MLFGQNAFSQIADADSSHFSGGGTAAGRQAFNPAHFELAASPEYAVRYERLAGVDVRFFVKNEHLQYRERYTAATGRALEYLQALYSKFPFDTLTMADAAPFDTTAWTFATPGVVHVPPGSWLVMDYSRLFEKHIFREIAAQYWSAGLSPKLDAQSWLLAGLADYNAMRMLDVYYGRHANLIDHLGLTLSDFQYNRLLYLKQVMGESEMQYAHLFADLTKNDAAIRAKAALVWTTLGYWIGPQQFERNLQTFYLQWRGKPPVLSNLLDICAQESGQNVRELVQQFLESDPRADYMVAGLQSAPWRIETIPPDAIDLRSDDTSVSYLSTISLVRDGDVIFPVETEVAFTDGLKKRFTWDGMTRKKQLLLLYSSPAGSAMIDPDQMFLFDENFANNSMTAKSQLGDEKLLGRWIFMLQNVVILLTSFLG